ncbi:MAG: response regulator [Candidatus Omnitrophota bacterium]
MTEERHFMSGKKILIIEDEIRLCEILELRFKDEGFEVVIANDGISGLDKANLEKPDIIILDLALPRLSGEEVCRQVRKDKIIGKTPIIMLTGKSADADRVIGRVIGANCYITKPFQFDELIDEVRRLMQTR